MKTYIETLRTLLDSGDEKMDRTGTGTISKFGGMMKFSCRHNLWPIPTTRQVAWVKILEELEWMMRGMINVKWLDDHDNKIWNAWAGEKTGTIGPMYGEQWRNASAGIDKIDGHNEEELQRLLVENSYGTHSGPELTPSMALDVFKSWVAEKTKPFEQGGRGGVDQFQALVDELRLRPDSRRMVVNVWQAGLLPDPTKSPKEEADLGKMALAPCHSMWQVNTANLTDFDILRLYVEKYDGMFEPILEQAFRINTVSNNETMENYIRILTNQFLFERGYVAPGFMYEKNYNLDVDRTLSITEEGQKRIDSWKAMGQPTRKISVACFARSQDVPLGTVFNVGMYSALCHILGQLTNMVPWEYTHFMGDYHIYSNQIEGVLKQLSRLPGRPARIFLNQQMTTFEDFRAHEVTVSYEPQGPIKFPMAAV